MVSELQWLYSCLPLPGTCRHVGQKGFSLNIRIFYILIISLYYVICHGTYNVAWTATSQPFLSDASPSHPVSANMNMNNSTSSISMGMMTPWLHFGNSDYLFFQAWRPSSDGAIVGACIGLFLFSTLERCLAAYRRAQELCWRAKMILMSSKVPSGEDTIPASRPLVPPFMPSHDILRGAIQAIQSTFSYALMLAVMTFNGAYIISIVLGLGFGEVLVGRIGRKQRV